IAQSTETCQTDDKSINMPSLTLIAKRFLTYFPQLEDLQIVRAWAAVTTYTKDDLPVFGFSRAASNFFTVAGFKGAFTVAPAVGQLTKDALEGHMDPDYRCCSPDRNIGGAEGETA
ncbi:MAG TPA: FAD-dependent oxidoreductase, partial [Armatimonadota bacterium]|nr:FAD-dependent oxidoreductase [Armatimonadota bacterium]